MSDKLILTGFKQLQRVMPCLTQNSIFQSSLSAFASFAVFFLCEDQLILHYRFVTLKLTLSVSLSVQIIFIVFIMQTVEWQSAGKAASKNSSRIVRLGGTVSKKFRDISFRKSQSMRTFLSYALRLCEVHCFQVVQNMVLKPFVLN